MEKEKYERKYLSQKELAQRWNCSQGTIIGYRKKGIISYFQLPETKKINYELKVITEIENQNTIREGGDKKKAEIKRVKPTVSTPPKKEWRI